MSPKQLDYKLLQTYLLPGVEFGGKQLRKIWDGLSKRCEGQLKKENAHMLSTRYVYSQDFVTPATLGFRDRLEVYRKTQRRLNKNGEKREQNLVARVAKLRSGIEPDKSKLVSELRAEIDSWEEPTDSDSVFKQLSK